MDLEQTVFEFVGYQVEKTYRY